MKIKFTIEENGLITETEVKADSLDVILKKFTRLLRRAGINFEGEIVALKEWE